MPNTGTPEQSFSWQHTKDSFFPSKSPESLDFFLTERYRLFSYNDKKDILLTGNPFRMNLSIKSASMPNAILNRSIS